jgi:hypothetical protein
MIEKTMTIVRKLMVALSIVFAVVWVAQQADTHIEGAFWGSTSAGLPPKMSFALYYNEDATWQNW